MTSRYDICTGRRDREGKTRWKKIGVMFAAREGDGFAIKLDLLPLPDEKGEVWIKAFVPRERDDESRDRRPQNVREAANRYAPGLGDDLNDSIPF